jgi:hypothetical protein
MHSDNWGRGEKGNGEGGRVRLFAWPRTISNDPLSVLRDPFLFTPSPLPITLLTSSPLPLFPSFLRQPVLLQTSIERATAQAECFGGAIGVAFKSRQRFSYQNAFGLLKAHFLEPRRETRIGL